MAAVVPAAIGSVMLAVIWAFAFRNGLALEGVEYTHTAWKALLVVCCTPLLLWAPTLAVVTYAYHRRRCRD